ncbi:MAG TPA: DUF1847 domain-containing protein [Desulfobacterales bacterium]|nr:DUF1847 domain-containing protein [Desulfobacterales bacterium]
MDNIQCAICSVKDKACRSPEGHGPSFCPTEKYREPIKELLDEYKKEEIHLVAKMASVQEAECYANRHIKPYVFHPVKPRVQEICEFAKKMNYRKIGIAFCAGLHLEAKALHDILVTQGFKVASVICKVGCTPKEVLGIKEEEKVHIGEFESMCSPIVQAGLLNREETELNVVVGLCVGHDSLFFKYSRAPVTVLVAKDRVLAHNPAGALYTSSTYYRRLKTGGTPSNT